jgi:hypothetical protein
VAFVVVLVDTKDDDDDGDSKDNDDDDCWPPPSALRSPLFLPFFVLLLFGLIFPWFLLYLVLLPAIAVELVAEDILAEGGVAGASCLACVLVTFVAARSPPGMLTARAPPLPPKTA